MTPDLPLAVELRGLTKQFGAVLANGGVNLRVEAGTIQGVIGENGAGKTTAMNLLYGLVRPDAGQIFIRGKECAWGSPQMRSPAELEWSTSISCWPGPARRWTTSS